MDVDVKEESDVNLKKRLFEIVERLRNRARRIDLAKRSKTAKLAEEVKRDCI